MSRTTVDRSKEVAALAPPAPPCFSTRTIWIAYLEDAAADQRPGRAPGPLVIERNRETRFNPKFGFCAECTDRHQGAMAAEGKCRPRFLLEYFDALAKAAV